MSQNIGFKLAIDDAVAYAPITLQPGQVSAFDLKLFIDPATITTDASASLSAFAFSGDQMTASIGALPQQITLRPRGGGLVYDYTYGTVSFIMSGLPGSYIPVQHTGAVTISAMGYWTSGNALSGESDAFENIPFTVSVPVSTFSIVFSTANVSPSAITNFTAVAQGDQAVVLTWANPTGNGVSATKLVYKMNAIPASSTDGTVVVVSSALATKTITGLTSESGEYYGFSAYIVDVGGDLSVAAQTSAYPLWTGGGTRTWASHKEHMRMRNLGYI
jgi:hypothetical protein